MKTIKVYQKDWKLLMKLKVDREKDKVADVISDLLVKHQKGNKNE